MPLKTALLVVETVGNVAALSVHQSWLEFTPNPAFQPKVIVAGFKSTVIDLSAFCPAPL